MLSIIIPTKNRKIILEETLQHIYTTREAISGNIEVIIINDGDESLEYLSQKYKNLSIHRNRHKGAASARNTGSFVAKNELLLFLDDDILVGKDCFARHAELHKEYPRSIVSGSWEYAPAFVETLNQTPFGRYKFLYDYKSLEGNEEKKLTDGVYEAVSLASFNLSIMRSDFQELQGFNETFAYAGCEDQEFTMRAKEKGFKLILDTTNVTTNNEKDRTDLKRWLNRQYTGIQGFPLLCELFPYRKQQRLFYENIPICEKDPPRIKIKKIFKRTLSIPPIPGLILFTTKAMEKLGFRDKALFRLYKGLCGIYIYKGFRLTYNSLQNKGR